MPDTLQRNSEGKVCPTDQFPHTINSKPAQPQTYKHMHIPVKKEFSKSEDQAVFG